MTSGHLGVPGDPLPLMVLPAHRAECTFGPGMFRVSYRGANGTYTRYCQDDHEVGDLHRLLDGIAREMRVERDGYCLDGDARGDARTPDVVDGEWWLGLPREQGMRELGLESEADYRRAYVAVEAAVARRDNRASQVGVRASIVIKRAGAKVTDV